MTKKETQMLNREKLKLADQHRGIKDMRRLPDLVVIVDAQYEDTAIKEARRLDIPTIAIVDSNTDPNKVTYPIPANDDSMRTINIIISALADAVLEAKGGNLTSNEIVGVNPTASEVEKNVPLNQDQVQEEE
jgi:small subunit ribosomal protein S2